MKQTLGPSFEDFRAALMSPTPVSVRVNVNKQQVQLSGDRIPWCQTGFYLKERPSFTLDPHFHAGAYYVQEASSMFLEQALKASVDLSRPLRLLDLCAAPGGKSTHLLSLISDESLLVSNEVIKTRASILSENIQKWGKANVVVTNTDPKHIGELGGYFDVVVVDAPCSGEGLFRKDPDAISEWSEDNVNLCSLRQRRILSDIWPAIKENGVLIYCTCTYNAAENEDNMVWLSEQHDVEFIKVGDKFSAEEITKGKAIGYRFYPHRVEGEGFFLCVVRKTSEEKEFRTKKIPGIKASKNNPGWLNGDFNYYELNELLIATPEPISDDIATIASTLNIVTRGIAVATIMRNKLIPEHSLALSVDIHPDAFPKMDVDLDQALNYLRKENLLPADNERGFALVNYEGSNMGFVNRLGNRLNNLYPANWRIRMR
jgi:NOL1/NOP2/sun family putative RNA methylase